MRRPRPDVAWSRGRIRRRAQYQAYITSPQWFARRDRWVEEWQHRHPSLREREPGGGAGGGPRCVVGGCAWSLESGDLHHVTYDRLGAERFEDLVAMCRVHHSRFHDIYDAHPAWRRMGRRAATRGIIAALQAAEMASGRTAGGAAGDQQKQADRQARQAMQEKGSTR